ncbi:MAG: MBL fold metallo-hydrolase [Proteobacteria bacterium]|nr:MBL fold metallo-hydrolase [Pseudomonadota bacterium]
MRVTVLCENTVGVPFPWGLIGEHGQALLIEGERTTLYDTGQGVGLINNMTIMSKQAHAIDRIIISHGHFDHTGGLIKVLENRDKPLPVYVHEEAFQKKIALIETQSDNIEVPIGFPLSKESYQEKGADFRYIHSFAKIDDEICAISDIARPDDWQTWDTRLKYKDGDTIYSDPFNDDLSLLLETGSGPVVLLGCAHAGLVEILNDLSDKTGHKTFHAVIGGTHLGTASDQYIQKSIDILKHYKVKLIGTSHCTGSHAASEIKSHFKKEFVMASVGSVFNF